MKVKDLLNLISDGSVHIVIIDDDTGEILLSTIWHNNISKEQLECEIEHITIKEYELELRVLMAIRL